MIKIELTEVFGWDAAIRGMRNPKNSWDKSDSYWTHIENPETLNTAPFQFFMGENDHKLAMTLANAGNDHGKFLRMIVVYCDVTGPLYWYKELDTYRAGVEKNSCSTMHKIHAKPFVIEDFSVEHLREMAITTFKKVLRLLNVYRNYYLEQKDKSYWWQLIQLLPSSYNQRRTYMFSYAALRNIYHARRHHKLDEWHTFCDWITTLPYSELITGTGGDTDVRP